MAPNQTQQDEYSERANANITIAYATRCYITYFLLKKDPKALEAVLSMPAPQFTANVIKFSQENLATEEKHKAFVKELERMGAEQSKLVIP